MEKPGTNIMRSKEFTDKIITSIKTKLRKIFHDDLLLVGSGKSGIYLGLRAIEFKKKDKLLIPKYLPVQVVKMISNVCTPTYEFTNDVKGVFVLHQIGFPQNMDIIMEIANESNLIVFEK